MSCISDLHVRPIRTHIQNVVLAPTYCPVRSDPHALKQRPIFPSFPNSATDIAGKVDHALHSIFEFDPNPVTVKRLHLSGFDQNPCKFPV